MSDSTALTTAADAVGNLISWTGGTNPFTQHAKAEGVNSGLYMRHNGNTGKYIVGDEEISGGTFVFDVMSAKMAWLGFDPNNKPINGPEVRMLDGVPLPDAPPTPGVKWNKQIKVAVIDVDTGKEILLSCKAEKPNRAIWKLIKAFGEQVSRHPDHEARDYMLPLVQASSREFEMDVQEPQPDGTKRKMRVKKYSDQYDIVDWYTHAHVEDIKGIGADAVVDEAPPMKDVTPTVEVLPPESQKTFPTAGAPAGTPAAGRSRFGQR